MNTSVRMCLVLTEKTLLQIELHAQMGFFESQPLIESVRIFAGPVSGQLNNVSTAFFGAFDCPFHHLAANSLILKFPVYAHRLDLGAQSTPIANRWQEYKV